MFFLNILCHIRGPLKGNNTVIIVTLMAAGKQDSDSMVYSINAVPKIIPRNNSQKNTIEKIPIKMNHCKDLDFPLPYTYECSM